MSLLYPARRDMAEAHEQELSREARAAQSNVLRIAALLIFSSFFSIFFWGLYVGWHGLFFVLLCTALNMFLGWNLAAGYRWARWAVAARCVLGVFLAVSTLIHLPPKVPLFSVLTLWTLANAAFYAVVGPYIVFSPRMKRHFDYSDSPAE